jgi:inositol phosphorylceramide synthase catalytic subunit
MYGRGIDVYGAYPSLHVSYPFLVAWATFMVPELKWARVPAVLFYGLMCFSAVYLQHHFIVDIILGSLYAAVLAGVATYWLRRRRGQVPAWVTRQGA